ncbi:MAG: FtsX-like permease family protein [Ruminococcus sp.]|nr:FtsX-like permease family protein [Ruminococcus sp.]
MFFDILKRDIKRKRTMNIIILLFVVLAVTFISSSASNLSAITSSLDTYFEKAGVGDYITIERGTVGKSAAEVARSLDYVDNVKDEDILYNTDGIKFRGKSLTDYDIVIISSVDKQIEKYYDENNNEITEVPEGGVYVRKSFLDQCGIEIGDKITVPISDTKVTLTVKGVLKDAVFGSMMMGIPRLLISQADFDKFTADENIELYKGAITFVNTDNISALEQKLTDCQNILFLGSEDLMKLSYIMEMLIAGILMIVSICLIIIALVILRFTISFTLSEEFREIGIMKAIGIPNRKIRGLYLIKYLSISIVGAVMGLATAVPFGNLLLKNTSESMLISNSGSLSLSIICAVFVVAIIMLFCYYSTRKVKKFTPVDAIRNGSTGERYKKKGILKMSKLRLKPVPFMAVNDILSGIRRFGIMLATFTIGILLITIVLNTITTLQSGKILSWFSLAESEIILSDKEELTSYIYEDGREKLEKDIEAVREKLSENGMEAKVFAEVSHKFKISKGDLSTMSLTSEGVNTTTDMYNNYIEGTPPQNKDEIAITFVIAEKIDASIGDTVTVSTPEGDREYIISAIFQSMNNLGEGIRFHQDEHFGFENLNTFWGMQIKFNDNPSDSQIAERIEKIKELYPSHDVRTSGEYVDHLIGVAEYLGDTKLLVVLIVLLINILVAVLMEKSFLTKERGEIAMLKAIGFKNRSIILWQILRIAIIMVIATLIAIALSNPIGQLSSGAVFKMMGAKYIIFDVNVLESYIIYPLIILATVVFGVFLTALPIRKINSNEINNVE